MSELCYDVFPSKAGWIGALASPRGLRRLTLGPTPQEALEGLGSQAARASHDPSALESIRRDVDAYLGGDQSALAEVPIDPEDAPPFFKAAWEACRTIPRGETTQLCLAGSEGGESQGGQGSGTGDGPEPAGADRTMPPGHRQRRWPARLRRRAGQEGGAVGPGAPGVTIVKGCTSPGIC